MILLASPRDRKSVSVDGNCDGTDVAWGAIASRLGLPLDVPAEGYRVIKYPFWTGDFMEFRCECSLVPPLIAPTRNPTKNRGTVKLHASHILFLRFIVIANVHPSRY